MTDFPNDRDGLASNKIFLDRKTRGLLWEMVAWKGWLLRVMVGSEETEKDGRTEERGRKEGV